MSYDLLPCPFCGSTNLRYEFAGSQGYIECNDCGTAGPGDERAADPICDMDAAYLAWNRRAALAQPEPEGPTDEDLTQLLFDGFRGPIEFLCDAEEEAHLMIRSRVKFARAVLARWGRPRPRPAGAHPHK
jgi:hypothetical protein